MTVDTLRWLLDPMTESEFFQEVCGKEIRHIQGPPDRFRELLDWNSLPLRSLAGPLSRTGWTAAITAPDI